MEIRIELDGTRPPRGRTLGGRAIHAFGGWLELIRALEELVADGCGIPNDEADPAEEGRSREGVNERVERRED